MQQKYDELKQCHLNNVKSIHSFLNHLSIRRQTYLDKYSNSKNNENPKDVEAVIDDEMVSMTNIEPKLMLNQTKMEQFLNKMSMIMLSRFNNDKGMELDLELSDDDI